MAKKQTRRSISVSRATYDRLKAFCESSGISMSQFVENRVGDVLNTDTPTVRPSIAAASSGHVAHATQAPVVAPINSSAHVAAAPAPVSASVVAQVHAAPTHVPSSPVLAPPPSASPLSSAPVASAPPVRPPVEPARPAPVAPFTSAAARIAVEPPPPVIKPKSEQPAPKPAEKRPDQIFTF